MILALVAVAVAIYVRFEDGGDVDPEGIEARKRSTAPDPREGLLSSYRL